MPGGSAEAPVSEEATETTGGDRAQQVLIVDGERLSGLIQKMLGKDYATDIAATGIRAVEKLRELLPDVIVVEADVPGGGFKLAELVGISPKYRGIPVIVMSGNPTPDMVIRAKNAGASSYLAKPFRPSDLHTRIKSQCALRGQKMADVIRALLNEHFPDQS